MCGLIYYVGETEDQLNTRMNGHRSNINTGGLQYLYKHVNQQDNSVLSIKFRIVEKISIALMILP